MNRKIAEKYVLGIIGIVLGTLFNSFLPAAFLGGCLFGAGFWLVIEAVTQERIAKRKAQAAVQQKLAEDKTAVSPVIGVILMVAITVVLAAVVFVMASQLGAAPETPPKLAMTASGDNFTVAQADKGLPWSDLSFGPGDASCHPALATADGSGIVAAGDVVRGCRGHLTVVHRPTNAVIYTH